MVEADSAGPEALAWGTRAKVCLLAGFLGMRVAGLEGRGRVADGRLLGCAVYWAEGTGGDGKWQGWRECEPFQHGGSEPRIQGDQTI